MTTYRTYPVLPTTTEPARDPRTGEIVCHEFPEREMVLGACEAGWRWNLDTLAEVEGQWYAVTLRDWTPIPAPAWAPIATPRVRDMVGTNNV